MKRQQLPLFRPQMNLSIKFDIMLITIIFGYESVFDFCFVIDSANLNFKSSHFFQSRQ